MALSVTSAPFSQVSMPALDLRRFLTAGIQSEGVRGPSDLAVSQRGAGANMSVDIAAGYAYVQGDAVTGQGMYFAYNDGAYNLTGFTGADPSLPRIDRVVLRVRDAFHGDAANDVSFQILTGTPSAGATLANLTGAASPGNGQLLLANVLVPASSSSITNANIDTAVRPLAGTGGGTQRLADVTLSSTAATIDFVSIPATSAHLMIVAYLRGDKAAATDIAGLRFNNDSTAIYDYQQLKGSAAATAVAEAFAQTSSALGVIPANSAGANLFGAAIAFVPHYANALNNKDSFALYSSKSGVATGNMDTGLLAGNWRSNAAINRITIFPATGNFVSGCRLTVYGMTS
jgi:hypothetical protein